MLARAANFVETTEPLGVPVFADGDTGFEMPSTYGRCGLYERAGVAAIQLEDQVAPKKCGHMIGRQVVPAEEMVGKIRAAVAARRDPDFAIVARTDARTSCGIEEAIRRARLYAEAGADVLFVESPESVEEMKAITASVSKPCLANMVEGGRTPLLSAQELRDSASHRDFPHGLDFPYDLVSCRVQASWTGSDATAPRLPCWRTWLRSRSSTT